MYYNLCVNLFNANEKFAIINNLSQLKKKKNQQLVTRLNVCRCVGVLLYWCMVVLVPNPREWELERVHALPQQLFCCCCCSGCCCCLLLFLLHSRLLQRRSLSPSIASLYLSRSLSSIIQRFAATLAFAAPPAPPLLPLYTLIHMHIYMLYYM